MDCNTKTYGILNDNIVHAYKMGYRVTVDGFVLSPKGTVSSGQYRRGYARYGIYINKAERKRKINIHKLMAYQKFGEVAFSDGMVVRHLNGICTDNSYDNILIGTQKENLNDRINQNFKNEPLLRDKKLRSYLESSKLHCVYLNKNNLGCLCEVKTFISHPVLYIPTSEPNRYEKINSESLKSHKEKYGVKSAMKEFEISSTRILMEIINQKRYEYPKRQRNKNSILNSKFSQISIQFE